MSKLTLQLLVLALACATIVVHASEGVNTEAEYTPKDRSEMMSPAHRQDVIEDAELADRAALLFRRLDVDFDKRIGSFDAEQSANNGAMTDHMPGVTLDEFKDFIRMADKDHDGHLSRDEFMTAIAEGLNRPDSPKFVETEETISRSKGKRGKQGFIGAIVDNLVNKATGFLRGLAGMIDKTQDSCVMCQYIVERIETNVKASGALTGAPGGFDDQDPYSFLETEVEADAQGPARSAISVISSTRQSTRYQRQVERQKFNEIYRIADITLDDVCEQGMPNAYYGMCKQVYKVQTDIVDGLRYQYRPTDICFRVGMCGKKSYIVKGIHSRYK